MALLVAGGLAAAIPLAVITSWPSVGRFLMRTGIGALPEEREPPAALRKRGVPAIEAALLRSA